MKNTHSEIIPRLYMKLLPIQILLVIIGGLNSIIDNAFAANFLGSDAMAVTGLFSPVTNFLNAINALVFGGETETVMENRQRLLSQNNMNMIAVKEDLSHLFAINAALDNGEMVSMPADRIFGSQKSAE